MSCNYTKGIDLHLLKMLLPHSFIIKKIFSNLEGRLYLHFSIPNKYICTIAKRKHICIFPYKNKYECIFVEIYIADNIKKDVIFIIAKKYLFIFHENSYFHKDKIHVTLLFF